MPTYVSLIDWTEKGITHFRDTTHRAQDFTNLVEKAGGRVHELLWTVGEHDLVCVLELPSDEALAAALLQVGEKGNIRTKTMRAFTAQQMEEILQLAD